MGFGGLSVFIVTAMSDPSELCHELHRGFVIDTLEIHERRALYED